MTSSKRVFISHSKTIQDWVDNFTAWLESNGIEVVAAAYDLKPGQDIAHFLEKVNHTYFDHVLILCERNYIKAVNKNKGLESILTQIVRPEVYKNPEQTKVIPIALELDDEGEPLLPIYLKGRKSLYFSDTTYEQTRVELLAAIHAKTQRTQQKAIQKAIKQSWSYSKDRSNHQYRKELSLSVPKMSLSKLVGRQKNLQEIQQCLQENQEVVVVNGMGGIGKTAVAQAYISQYYDNYEYILWIDLNESKGEEIESSLEADFVNTRGLLEVLNIQKENKKIEDLYYEILNHLANITHHPGLIILDNATSRINPHYKYLPKHPNWHLLVTSREALPKFKVHDLDFLSMEEAKILFKQNCPSNRFSDAFLEELIELVEYHTLVITVIATSVEYSDTYNEEKLRQILKENGTVYIEDKQEKIKQFLVNYFKSQLDRLSDYQKHLLLNFACLPSSFHPYEDLEVVLPKELPSIPTQSMGFIKWIKSLFQKPADIESITSQEDIDLSMNLNTLCKKSWLLKESSISSSFSYRMHRITAEVVWEILFEGDYAIDDLIANVILLLGEREAKRHEELSYQFKWLPYAETLLNKANNFSKTNQSRITQALGDVYRHLGKYKDAKKVLEKLVTLNKEEYGDFHYYTAAYYSDLATVLEELGELQQAKKLLLKALSIIERDLGERHPSTAIIYSNLALVLQDLEEFRQAKILFLKALNINENHFGKQHYSTAISYSNLATLLKDLGELQQAKELFLKAKNITENNFGKQHHLTATSYSNLAMVLVDVEELYKAKLLLTKALNINENHFGKQHHLTATSYSNLALVLRGLGEPQQAKILFLKAKNITENNFGKQHPLTAKSYSNLALVLQDLGELQQAKRLLLKATNIIEEKFGKQHTSTAIRYSNLALVLQDLGELQQAKRLLLKATNIMEEKFGKQHTSTATRYYNLAMVLQDLGELKQVKSLLIKALNIFEKTLGKDHFKTITTRNSLKNLEKL